MKHAMTILAAMLLSAGVMRGAGQSATNSASSPVPLRPETDAYWENNITTAHLREPLSALSITNRLSQDDILGICDPISMHHGLTRYREGMCGFGARLSRDYVGFSSVVSVLFLWDGSPKVTRFAFYGTDATAAVAWHTDLLSALRSKVGAESVKVEVQPSAPANGASPRR